MSGNSVGMRLLDGANHNTIRHNNFVNNNVQVYVQSSYNNIWNDGYPSGGNYWSDYGGVDLYGGLYQNEVGSDGVGDTPYAIDANNMDRWPLMTQWIELLADINHDRIVNISDAVMLAGVFGTVPTSLNWNPDADLNSDNAVDIFDAIILANNFGGIA
jgi:nitrous oxidase accessory protein NosD